MAETKKVAEEKPKNILGKIKEAVDDKEEQLAYLATLIRVIVLIWSAGILTLNYGYCSYLVCRNFNFKLR